MLTCRGITFYHGGGAVAGPLTGNGLNQEKHEQFKDVGTDGHQQEIKRGGAGSARGFSATAKLMEAERQKLKTEPQKVLSAKRGGESYLKTIEEKER